MSELTKRKAFALQPSGDGEYESDGDATAASTLLSEKDGDVRVVEYDVRPSCANDAPLRYVKHGEQLTPVVKGVAVAAPAFHARFTSCFSLRYGSKRFYLSV